MRGGALATAARALRLRWRPLGAEGAQIMRMARTEMSAEEVERLVGWIAAQLGRAAGEIPDRDVLGRLEYVVRRWLEPDQRRQLERAMVRRSVWGASLVPSEEREDSSGP